MQEELRLQKKDGRELDIAINHIYAHYIRTHTLTLQYPREKDEEKVREREERERERDMDEEKRSEERGSKSALFHRTHLLSFLRIQ